MFRSGEMHRYCTVFVLMAMLLLFPGCSKREAKKPPPPAIKVTTAKALRGDLSKYLHVSGPLRFIANTTVSAEVSAQVESIEVSDGQAVEKGQLLLVFDDAKIREIVNEAEYALRRDEALLKFGKAEYEKNLTLLKSGSVSQTAFDQKLSVYENLIARVEMNRASLAKAQEDLKETRVRAPIAGRMSKRYVEKGDWVTAGGRLFRISDFRKIYLEAHVTDLDLAKLDVPKILKEGVDADVVVDSYPDRPFAGKLTYVEAVAGQSRLFEIRIYMDNQEMLLLEGMYGRGKISFDKLKDKLKIPLSALLNQVRDDHRNTVFRVDSTNRAQLTRIRLGATNRKFAEVKDGLEEGDRVVIKGKEVLTSGILVEPVESF